MSSDVTASVVPYDESADIAVITYEGMAVSVTKDDGGKFIVNLERVTDSRVDVEVVVDGDESIWEGNLP